MVFDNYRSCLLLLMLCYSAYPEAPDTDFRNYVYASSEHSAEHRASHAVDGDKNTRWASASGKKGEFLQIDLGQPVTVGPIRISWEQAYAQAYCVLGSLDGQQWDSLYCQSEGQGGVEEIPALEKTTRYIRIVCNVPGLFPLYSIWEVNFHGIEARNALRTQRKRADELKQREREAAADMLLQSLDTEGVEAIVFAERALYQDGHWYANISYYAESTERKTYVHGSALRVLQLETGEIRSLIDDPEGTIRDPAVHYDGRRILFSWRKGGTDTFHLYTINSDGTALTQLTRGEYDDIEPAWLPDGGIVFVSSRCRRWVNCWLTQVAVIHRCDADGRHIRPLSANLEQDNTPWPLPDGRILYTRWEYIDRSQVDYHHLWTMNPDGTGQAVYFGNMHPPGLYIDAKPVPGTGEVLFINSPGHGSREHTGQAALVHAKEGPDELQALQNISENGFRDPYAITETTFLAVKARELVLFDRTGNTRVLYRLPVTPDKRELHEPRPLIARAQEPVIPPRVQYEQPTGKLVLANAHLGRTMEGVKHGDIAKFLIVEPLPKPINYTGGMDPLSYGGTFTLERILGEVPVEEDGSAYLEVPANRSLFFIALDAQNNTVKRMQSFLTVMPGETLSCIGCHENRVDAPVNPGRGGVLEALRRPPSIIQKIPGIPEVFDFPRDIQPILDNHCIRCHDYEKHAGEEHGPRSGGVILTGDRGPLFSHSYAALTIHGQVADGRNRAQSNYPPRALGAVASPLMHKIDQGHHDVSLSEHEKNMVRYWIETGASYPGTYGALGAGCIGGYHAYLDNRQSLETDYYWPTTVPATAAIERRCLNCHQDQLQIPKALSDENGLSFWRPEWDDPRLKRSRHLVFNLSRPEYSLILLAPLSREAGGYGTCQAKGKDGVAVFTSQNDEDYQKLLSMIEAGKQRLETIKRFDMEGYRPPEPYLREMKRYGILEEIPVHGASVDCYQLDRDYWRSFNHDVALEHEAYRDE